MSKLSIDASRIKAFIFDVDGVLSATTVQLGHDGMPIRTANVRDGYAIKKALKAGYKIAIISGGSSEAVVIRYNILGINDIFMSIKHKLPVMQQWLADNGLSPEDVAFMGDDIPDLPCMRIAGLAACPYDASVEALHTSTFISKYTGGHACVRDLIESVMRAQGTWPDLI